ncbi:doubled CXXCH domain-containing protein [Persephonella hydrogeniphila]|uniref:Doubled CXXCH domain-containing protein n=1 Tax=Persephonella hydrogeniphila TaxID=198703 RepID=A0A285NP20_9AQUI|nr:cytochrome c3 family protein [Persephonella hydrogeniphila]SNZ11270.1 doubled CXXCH domain-containing protein [Persephonella hydrogeniphila]
MFLRNLVASLMCVTTFSYAGIELTKHNLSVSGPGTVKAVSETEICVFCHIPHHEKEGTPLWNRKMPTSVYTLYDSEFISRINYPTPQQPSEVEGQPGIVSRQCLSCHDGTVAIGAVYIVRGTELGNSVIQMQNVNPDGTLPSTLRTFIGTDLSIHHPVAIEYDPNIQKTFGDGSVKTIELRNPHPLPPIKLYTYGGKNYVECTSCHDPHKQNKQFLRVDVGNLAQDFKQTCISCHDKPGWSTSPHNTDTRTYTDTGVNQHYGEGSPVSVADLGCGNCHKPHNTPPYPPSGKPLLRKPEEQTCFKGAAGQSNLAPCHGAGGAKDIESLLPPDRTYGHPVKTISDIHTIMDVLYGFTSTEVDPASSFSVKFSDSKHAECMDCHNPHKASPGTHAQNADPSGWYPQNPTNLVSNVLAGVYGVEPLWPSARWTQPSTYTTKAEAEKEYQICMKCHSRWGLGDSPNGDCTTQFTSDQSGIKLTDQSCEFNPYNRSAHPVVMTTNEMLALGGRYADPLTPSQLLPPWNTNVGNQTMYCTDCHGADAEDGVDPRGPHGSTHKFMLKGPNTNWPTKTDGTLYTTGDVKDGTTDGLFCTNCHDLTQADPHMITRPMAMYSIACVECHVAVPHGSPISRLIGYRTMPEPYNYNYNGTLMLKLDGFVWNTVVQRRDAYSTDNNCDCHWNAGGYDTYP